MMGRRCYNPTPAAGVSRRFGSEKASSIVLVVLSALVVGVHHGVALGALKRQKKNCRAPREAVAFRVKISCGLASRGLVQGERKAAERGGSPHASWPSRLQVRMNRWETALLTKILDLLWIF